MFTDNKVVIDCEKRLSLGNYSYINNITGCINDYDEENNVVKGNVLLTVDYNYENELCKKEELIPFEINLLNGKTIEEIVIINFRYYEIVGDGLQCSFQIYLTVKDCENNNENLIINEENLEENNNLEEKEIENKYDSLLDEIFLEEKNTNDNDINENEIDDKENSKNNEESNNNDNEAIIDENNNHDEEIDIYYQKHNKCINVDCNCKGVGNNEIVSLRNIKEMTSTFSIYYPKTEHEIDKVCVSENVSLQTIYSNQLNKEFPKKKRIIIEK